MKNKIVCFHMLNNYSGSPLVLSVVLKGLVRKGYNIDLFTSQGDGLLSNIEGINYFSIYFTQNRKKIILLLIVFYAQLRLFFDVLIKYHGIKNLTFYVNTICPFGAALAGKLLGADIIYHCHEVYINPNPLDILAKHIKSYCANRIICVSDFVSKSDSVILDKNVVYNSLEKSFIDEVNKYLAANLKANKVYRNVLMISSLKTYKGIYQLLKLARMMPKYHFIFVAGASKYDVELFISTNDIPINLEILSERSDVHRFYQASDVLINLSVPTLWQETFGMTLLEGMTYGLPVIAPPVGGPIEIVDDGIDGFLVDSRNIEEVAYKLELITKSNDVYSRMSNSAIKKAKCFNAEKQVGQIEDIITNRNSSNNQFAPRKSI